MAVPDDVCKAMKTNNINPPGNTELISIAYDVKADTVHG